MKKRTLNRNEANRQIIIQKRDRNEDEKTENIHKNHVSAQNQGKIKNEDKLILKKKQNKKTKIYILFKNKCKQQNNREKNKKSERK